MHTPMKLRQVCRLGMLVTFSALLASTARAATWFPLGPYGGDARSFAADPHDSKHLYLGTETGWVYQTHDGGRTWDRVSQVEGRSDLVIDHILTDPASPSRLIVGAWIVNRPSGGIYISDDGGKHWETQAEMSGQSVRALARSSADPNLIIAGTLQGVYRSQDDGRHWKQISPAGSTEIHEIESVAIDPKDPKIIYAGTWHLPWKTVDGGATWFNIKQGIIDDSDVFSIIVDPTQPNVVYASACSGIYKSLDAGGQFKGGVSVNKTQGIPATARRTRKLMQDPGNANTVYAGTTQGLYRTTDGGEKWVRMTGDDVVVNDVYIDPNDTKHVLLATDRGGVLRSDDAAISFQASNKGFSSRQVVAYASDPSDHSHLYVGVVNDKQNGGVFMSRDGGVQWDQMNEGLGGRDVFSLATIADGTVLAGTTHGIFRLDGAMWSLSSAVAPPPPPHETSGTRHVAGGKAAKRQSAKELAEARRAEAKAKVEYAAAVKAAATSQVLADSLVYSLAGEGSSSFAATSTGLWKSDGAGQKWTRLTLPQLSETRFVAARGPEVLAGSLSGLAFSADHGANWQRVMPPATLTQIGALTVDGEGGLWIGGPEGVFYSTDHGATWKTLRNLFVRQVDGIYYDAEGKRILVTASGSTTAFAASVPDYKVTYWDTGWKLRFMRPVGDHLIGATLFDGMVVQPKMVASAFTSYGATESASTGAGASGTAAAASSSTAPTAATSAAAPPIVPLKHRKKAGE